MDSVLPLDTSTAVVVAQMIWLAHQGETPPPLNHHVIDVIYGRICVFINKKPKPGFKRNMLQVISIIIYYWLKKYHPSILKVKNRRVSAPEVPSAEAQSQLKWYD